MRRRRVAMLIAVLGPIVTGGTLVACGRFAADDASNDSDGGRDGRASGYAIDVSVDAPPPPDQPCSNKLVFQAGTVVDWSTRFMMKSARLDETGRWFVSMKEPLATVHAAIADGGELIDADGVVANVRDTTKTEEQAMVIAYGQGLIFQSDRLDAGYPQLHLGVRTDLDAAFKGPVALDVGDGFVAQDPYGVGVDVYFARQLGIDKSKRQIHHGTLTAHDPPTLSGILPLASLGPASGDDHPVVTLDQLEIFWASKRTDAGSALYHASRATRSEPFADVQAVTVPNGLAEPSWISPDGCDLYMVEADKLYLLTRR